MNAGIDLDAVEVGDWLTVDDSRGNRLRGPVLAAGDVLEVGAFAGAVPVARRGRVNHRMTPITGVRITGHQPQLFPAP